MALNSNPQPVAAEFRPDEVVAERYRILDILGAGPNSKVYRAADLLTGDVIAIKVIARSAMRDPGAVSTYRVELNLFRQIDHPGLVRILDCGEYLGRMYVAMELVEGCTLEQHLKTAKQLALADCSRLFEALCASLTLLHAQHVVHRGLHPGNITRSKDGAWKVMEFGIGRHQKGGQDPARTAFLAPEQLRGLGATFAADIYSIGALTYEALTGAPVTQRAKYSLASSGVPPDRAIALAELLERCLQVDPAQRYQNIGAIKAAADRVLTPIHDGPGGRRIEDLLSESGVPAGEIAAVFARVVRDLIALHASGGSHAELSPHNIRVSGDRAEFEPRTRDSAVSSGHATLLIADAKYAAPELILARTKLNPAAHACGDVYVLGFLFYELLAGRKALQKQFGDSENMQTGLAWMRWHADPASTLRPLGEVAPGCPKGLAELIDRMVQKDPARRIRALEDVAAELDRLNIVLARTQPFAIGSLTTPRLKRKRLVALPIAAGALAFALIAGTVWLGYRSWAPLSGSIRGWFGGSAGPPVAGAGTLGQSPAVLDTATGAMVFVPEGKIKMAGAVSSGADPGNPVRVAAFYIDRLEVTNGLYREFCARTGRRVPAPPEWDLDYATRRDLPAVNVTRNDAAAFCGSSGKRLPSEAEWEMAAGGADEATVVWGNWTLPGLANLKLDGSERPAAVGSFASDVSPFGVLDAAGNVQEWVSGQYAPTPAAAPAEALKATLGVVCGGGFATPAQQLTPASRYPMPLEAGAAELSSVGFRCAADVRAAGALSAPLRVAAARP